MITTYKSFIPTLDLARKLISEQFPEYRHLHIAEVEKQGHDNRTYRLGNDMLIRMPTAESYALKVPKEQEFLPKFAPYLHLDIPIPLKMGAPCRDYPYPFSIYKWLSGKSLNLLQVSMGEMEQHAVDLSNFLKELQAIKHVDGPAPGQHNWWRGDHISVYDKDTRKQIIKLIGIIDSNKALDLWEKGCATRWDRPPVWIHGDFAIGNILAYKGKLSAVIDFGGAAMGDPACDLVISWTYLEGKARNIFINEMYLDEGIWLRARGWVLWKATWELCQIKDKNSYAAELQKRIIEEVIKG